MPKHDKDGYFDTVKVQKKYEILRRYKSEDLAESTRHELNKAYLASLSDINLKNKRE